MISIEAAAQLLNFGARIGPGQRADEQLAGAVAIHNLLEEHGIAYLADEVGMGKTYVALGALALLRHFNPDFRALIIAPRENIQMKWMKELGNFVANNVRFPDLRVKAIDGRPVRAFVRCSNLVDLVCEASLNPDRDFFLRMSSFSVPVAGRDSVDPEGARRLRDGLRKALPWLRDEVFDLRNKQKFKDNVARAVCCALPHFDLVIVDEAHNLKHGFNPTVAARNRVLGLAFGRPDPDDENDSHLFPGYGPRAERLLFLSATPVEESYKHLWNQLDIFDRGKSYRALADPRTDEAVGKELVRQFLIRRVTAIRVGGRDHTKNLYRREWRRGGVEVHDEPTRMDDPKQRLVVALVQKKVSELLGTAKFNCSFQIGMLASFESFLETARLKQSSDDSGNFDDSDQTADPLEKEGIDVADINRLSRSYRNHFGSEMPHPKMDSLVRSLSSAWLTGRKSLVFVRRVASVKEIKRKLDDEYDKWLIERLRAELPGVVRSRLERLIEQYRAAHDEAREAAEPKASSGFSIPNDADQGGTDTFFAWFFRGKGPGGVVSGANVQERFIQRGTAYSTFFNDNYVADLLGCTANEVTTTLATVLGLDSETLRAKLRERSNRFLTRAKKPARADRYEAVQAAAVELLMQCSGPWQEAAQVIWHERFSTSLVLLHAADAPPVGGLLEQETFFTRLRSRPILRDRLWPASGELDIREAFRERELRRELLASAARLGHAFIDLYVMTIRRLGSLDLRAIETRDGDATGIDTDRIDDYLDLLERQMGKPPTDREWCAFDELAAIAENFELIIDVNEPDARTKPLAESARVFGQLLRKQQPVGGMSGQLNQTLVRQFRMPGYPLLLITTDLLQEGEDLHTFCSDVHHYGIAWTPSSMEQRIGRIDRVRSHTERRISGHSAIEEGDKLQVYFPHLEDSVEVLQVGRILARMNDFLRLMHDDLVFETTSERTVNTRNLMASSRQRVEPINEPLKTAFPVREKHIAGEKKHLAVTEQRAEELRARFERIATSELAGLTVEWERQTTPGVLHGTVRLTTRIQPVTLMLRSFGSWASIRCISPVGIVDLDDHREQSLSTAARSRARVGAINLEPGTYNLTAEDETLLAADAAHDSARVSALVRRVAALADTLEQERLPGRDEVLATFRADLEQEAVRGR